MYKIVRNLLFLFPPEWVHYFSMNCLKILCSVSFLKKAISRRFKAGGNHTKQLFGLQFNNPVGLAAGFDKNGLYLNELEALGFGFVEIGTVTPQPQEGNAKPRLFRLPKDKALINRMGFNNHGAKAIAARLRQWQSRLPTNRLKTQDSSSAAILEKTKSHQTKKPGATMRFVSGNYRIALTISW